MSRCGGDEAATRFETSRSPAPSLAAGMQMDKPLTKSGASELQVLASEGFVGDIIYICAFVPLGVLAFWRLELSSRFTVTATVTMSWTAKCPTRFSSLIDMAGVVSPRCVSAGHTASPLPAWPHHTIRKASDPVLYYKLLIALDVAN